MILKSLPAGKLVLNLMKAILFCAKACIALGKVRGYKCFWSCELEEYTNKRDRFRRRAELTKRESDIVAWP